jgi:CheY-like chemotaxis protein
MTGSFHAACAPAGAWSLEREKPMKKRILLVEDDGSISDALSNVLEMEGYEVVSAENGREAVVNFSGREMDLLLLDLGLPVQDGCETLKWLAWANPLLPVIIITGRHGQRELVEAAGAYALAEKPLNVPRLLQTISALLEEPMLHRARRLGDPASGFRYVPCETWHLLGLPFNRCNAPPPAPVPNRALSIGEGKKTE